jgi:Uncharacterised protein family (UPF0158)
MALPVSLDRVIEAIEDSIEGYRAFLNRRTGEVFGGDMDLIDEEDGDEDLPGWLRREAARLRAVASSEDWLLLPDEFRCETAPVLERFCKECCVGATRRELLAHLRSNISMGLMKSRLGDLGLYEDWEAFRRERIAERAAAWLSANGIPFRK